MTNRRPGIQRPIALVVAGMHRSGTSALGYCLSQIGAGLPLHLVGASSANERGHWEPERVIALNDRYLDLYGSGWDDWRKLDLGAQPPSVKAAFAREIKSTIRSEYPGQTLLMLKDPRISRMIPLYDQALREAGYEPRYVVCMRNPVEVVASLSERDGMSESYASLLWLRHMLDAEFATRSLPRSLHAFDALLDDWRGSLDAIGKDLKLKWPRTLDDAEAKISSFLDQALRHFWNSDDTIGGSHAKWLLRAWAGLQAAGSAKGRRELDAVRAEFDKFCAEIGDQVVPEIYARQRQVQRETRLHRENAESLAARLRAEVDRAEKAEALLAAATAQPPSSEPGQAPSTAAPLPQNSVEGQVEPAAGADKSAVNPDVSDPEFGIAASLTEQAGRADKAEAQIAGLTVLVNELEQKLLRAQDEHLRRRQKFADDVLAAKDSVESLLSRGAEADALAVRRERELALHTSNASELGERLSIEAERAQRAEALVADLKACLEEAEARIVRQEQEAGFHQSRADGLSESLRATTERAEAAELALATVHDQLMGNEQRVLELLAENTVRRENEERMAALLSEEVDAKHRAEGFLAEASARIEDAEGRILRLMNESALSSENATELEERLRTAVNRIHQLESDAALLVKQIACDEDGLREQRENWARESAEARQVEADLTERLRLALDRVQQVEAEAGHLEQQLVALERTMRSEQESREREATEARRMETDLTERLRSAADRIQQLEIETKQWVDQCSGSEERLRMEREARERLEAKLARMETDHADLADRHSRITQDHVGLAERHDRLISDHGIVSERLVQVETEYAEVAVRLNEANALITELNHQVAAGASQYAIDRSEFAAQLAAQRHSETLLKREIAARDVALQESAARTAALEQELRAAIDRQIASADLHDQRLGEIVLRFGDQANEALRASERHSAERAALSERLLQAEKDGARAAAMVEHIQRAASEADAVAVALRLRLAQTEAELAKSSEGVDAAARDLTERNSRLAKLQAIISEAAVACGFPAARSEAEPEALIAVLSNLRASAATAAALESSLAMEQERSERLARDLERLRQEMSKALETSTAAQISTIEESGRREAALHDQASRLMEEVSALKAALQAAHDEARAERFQRGNQGLAFDTLSRRVQDAEERERQLVRDLEDARKEIEALARGDSEDMQALQTAVADRTAERDAAYDRLREAKSEKEALIQQMGHILLDAPGNAAGSIDSGVLEALRREVIALRNSTSWKVTAPLRGVGRLFGRGQK